MKKVLAFLFLLFPALLFGQLGNVTLKHFQSSAAGISCNNNQVAVNDTNGDFFSCDVASGLFVKVSGTGGGTPGGSDTNLQYNNAGAFGGFADGTAHQTLHGGRTFGAVTSLDIDSSVAPIDSPHFTTIPTAPTAGVGVNTAQLATTAFVQAALVARKGFINATDFGVQATGGALTDATTASGSPNIVCPNSDCQFNANNVGNIFFATDGADPSVSVCPQTTILSVTDANHLVLNANCTVSKTALAQIAYGPDDGPALATAWAAAVAGCLTLQLPTGVMIVQQPEFNSATSGCAGSQTWQVPGVFGYSSTATVIIPTPNFNFTNCTGGSIHACFFGVNFSLVFYLKIWGLGVNPAGCGANTLTQNRQGLMYDVVFVSWCKGGAGSVGTDFFGQQSEGLFGGDVAFGQTTCRLNGVEATILNWPCYGSNLGLQVTNGTEGISQGEFYGGAINLQVDAGGTLSSYTDTDFIAGDINVNGRLNLYGYKRTASAGSSTFFVNKGGSLYSINSKIAGNSAGPRNTLWGTINPAASFTDLGGNTYGGTSPAVALPQNIQSKNCTPAAGSTQACAYTTALTAGDFMAVTVVWNPTGNTVTGCSGSVNGALTQQGSTLNTPSVNHAAESVAFFYKPNITGGAETVTCTFSGSVNSNLGVIELQGVALTSPIDVAQTNTGSGSSVSITSPVTTLASDLVLVAGATNFGGSISSPGTGYTVIPLWNAGVIGEARNDTYPAGTYTATATLSNTTYDWAFYALGIKSSNPTMTAGVFSSAPQSGVCTFSGTACTVTFPTAFQALPACSASDQTAAAPVKAAPTLTQVVLTGGTGAGATDVAAWNCK